MKKLANLVALATALITVAFVSCSGITTNDATVSSSENKTERRSVKLIATSDDNLINFGEVLPSAAARTIMPAQKDASGLEFYMLYKNNTANQANYTLSSKLTFTPDKTITTNGYSTGTITQTFSLADYSFILYAIDTADAAYSSKNISLSATNIASSAHYVAYANADLRYYDTIRFKLQPNTATGGKGVVDLKIEHENDWEIPANYRVTAAIRKINNDEDLVYPSSNPEVIYGSTLGGADKLGTVQFTKGEVPAGEYNLVIAYNKFATNSDQNPPVATYYYTEKIVVLLNQTTQETITVPEILEREPAAPDDVIVGFKIPENLDTPYYEVRFAWADKADNESEYILELKQIDDSSFPVQPNGAGADAAWETLTATESIVLDKLNYQASEFNPGLNDVNGSLNKNSTFVTVLLPLEHRYVARISASNATGKSTWAYPAYTITGAATTLDPNDWNEFEADVKTINQFKITYDLNGGKFVNADATGTNLAAAAVLSHYARQKTDTQSTPAASTDHVKIINPDAITANSYFTDVEGLTALSTGVPLTIANNGQFWKNWVRDSDVGNSDYTQNEAWQAVGASYIANIKYYINGYDNATTKGELGSQPTASTWNGGKYGPSGSEVAYFVRKVTPEVYTGYTNLTLVAKYDTSKILYIETDNMQYFELKDEMIASAFKKGGSALTTENIDSAANTAANSIDDLSKLTNKLLSVSQSKVDTIEFTLTGKFVIAKYDEENNTFTESVDQNYDKAHLVITRVRDNVKLVDADWDASNKWTIPFSTWTPGKYTLMFTSNISEQPKTTYSYSCAMEITQ